MPHPVLLISDGLIHPPLAGRRLLARFLASLPEYALARASSLEALVERDASAYRALVLYFHHERISPAALDALEAYTRAGGGVVALHSAAASFKQSPRYTALLGGRFIRHGPVEPFTLEPEPGSALFAGIPAFTIRDELYRHEYAADIQVHFSVPVAGEREPFVWTRAFGAGRVLYLAPGHQPAVWRDPQLQEILRRGLAWACGSTAA